MHEHEKRLEALLAAKTEAPRAQAKLALPTQALLGGGPARSGDVALVAGGDAHRLPAQRGRSARACPSCGWRASR